MSTTPIPLMLRSLSLSYMASQYEDLHGQAAREGWDHERFLRLLCERELQHRAEKRTARILREAHLPEGKSLASLDQDRLPARVRRQLAALLDGGFVDRAENVLRDLGFASCRVRSHGSVARIEVEPDRFGDLMHLREQVCLQFSTIGYTYICLDLQGLRSGSMNDARTPACNPSCTPEKAG